MPANPLELNAKIRRAGDVGYVRRHFVGGLEEALDARVSVPDMERAEAGVDTAEALGFAADDDLRVVLRDVFLYPGARHGTS